MLEQNKVTSNGCTDRYHNYLESQMKRQTEFDWNKMFFLLLFDASTNCKTPSQHTIDKRDNDAGD